MTDQELNQLTRRALLDAARLEYQELLEELPEHTFSPAFERSMKKLLRRGRHPVWYRTLHAAACVLLALILSGCAVLAASPEAREVFAGWVREVYETCFIYRFSGTGQEIPVRLFYRPTYIPSGYRMTQESVTDGPRTIIYQDGFNHMAVFTCFPDGASPVFQIERDGTVTYRQITVNGMPAELYLDQEEGEANVLLWKDENEGAIFCISAPVSETELVKMAESVEAVPAEHRLEWVPEGYELVEETYRGYTFSVYSRPDGETILFSVYPYTDSLQIHVDMEEGDDYRQVRVTGRPADLYLDATGEKGILIWMDETEHLVFMLDGALTEEELIKIAEHVRRAPIPPTPHSPAWLPEGYHRKGYSGGEEHMEEWYAKNGSGQIRLHYESDGLAEELRRELGDLEPQGVLVNSQPARLYADAEGIRHLIWDGAESGSGYWLAGPLSAEELIRIAESIGKPQG